MISTFQMYLITRLTTLSNFLNVLMIFNVVALTIFGTMFCFYHGDTEYKNELAMYSLAKSMIKKLSISFIIISILGITIPSTREAAAIIIVPKIVNNTAIQDCAKNLVETANSWMLELKNNCEEK